MIRGWVDDYKDANLHRDVGGACSAGCDWKTRDSGVLRVSAHWAGLGFGDWASRRVGVSAVLYSLGV